MNKETCSLYRLALLVVVAAACSSPRSSLASLPLRPHGPYDVEVLIDGDYAAPNFWHRGEMYVMGSRGQRYTLRVHNHSQRRVEAVVSVDGQDVIDGKAGSYSKRGYLVPAGGSVDIEGWRLSSYEVAAFRFSSVAASYAGLTGRARNVGAIGIAIFPERFVTRESTYIPYSGLPRQEEENSDFAGANTETPSEMKRAPAPSRAEGQVAGEQAAAAPDSGPSRRQSRPGLGTEFGEQQSSLVHEVAFVRAHAFRPQTVVGLRYNDRRGLAAIGIDVEPHSNVYSDAELRRTAEPFPASSGRFANPPAGWNGH